MGAPPFALDRDKVRDNPCAKHTLKDYIIIEELFRSNTGAVYKVRRRSDKKILVLKERRVAELGKRAPADHEANLLRRVGRHPHLIGCHGHFWERARLYVVLDYAAGGDLAQLLKRRTLGDRAYFLPEDWVWLAFEQVCRGLLALHEQKVVHRDIKALNVLVSPTSREVFEERGVPRGLAPLPKDPNLRVADLGVSRECSENTIMLRTMFGTPLYASPEICDGTPYDAKTDVWSLGVVLYELCALQPPFTANNLVALAKTIKAGAFEPLGDHYSSLLKEVVSMCLRVDGRARPTVQKLVQVCEDRRSGATVTLGEKAYESPPASPAKPPPKPATPPPKPVALPPTPEVSPPKTARDARRLEALLRRRRTHLTNLRAAAALRDADSGLTPRELAQAKQRAADIERCERDVAALVQRLREAVPRKLAASPRPPASPTAPPVAPPASPTPEAPAMSSNVPPARLQAFERARRAREEDHHLGVEAADPFLFCKERDQKARRSRKAAMFGGRPAGFADGPPLEALRRRAPPRTAPSFVGGRRAAVRPAPPSPEPVAPAAPRPARAATAAPDRRPRRDPPPPSRVVSRDATPRSRTPPAPLIPGLARRPSEESLPNYNAPFAKRGHTPAWRVDVGQTTNEKERSNARLERLRRRGAARRARLEAQVEAAAAEPESILVA